MSHHYEETSDSLEQQRRVAVSTGTAVITATQEKKILDSGQRQEFQTGSVRDTSEGKGRFDLLPYYSLMKVSQHFEEGAKKYAADNWRKGQPLSRYFDSAQRHLAKFAMGFNDEPHLTAAIWNLLCYIETSKRVEMGQLPKELNDFPRVSMEFKDDKKI
jgi:hypothetical protein